jgi:hypothetical protein
MPQTDITLVDQVATALEAAGHAPMKAVNFDQVTAAGYKVRASRYAAVYVYAELEQVTRQQQNTLAQADSSHAWRTAADEIDAGRQARRQQMLRAYADVLQAEGFTVELLDLDNNRARLRVPTKED